MMDNARTVILTKNREMELSSTQKLKRGAFLQILGPAFPSGNIKIGTAGGGAHSDSSPPGFFTQPARPPTPAETPLPKCRQARTQNLRPPASGAANRPHVPPKQPRYRFELSN